MATRATKIGKILRPFVSSFAKSRGNSKLFRILKINIQIWTGDLSTQLYSAPANSLAAQDQALEEKKQKKNSVYRAGQQGTLP